MTYTNKKVTGRKLGRPRNISNAAALRKLMDRNKLTRARVAELCVVGRSTVDSWLAPKEAASHRAMPDRAIDMLELRLQVGNLGPKAGKTD